MSTDQVIQMGAPPEPDPTLKGSERGPGADTPPPRRAVGYVHTTHPDTGLAVVFMPGETLPEWASETTNQKPASAMPTKRQGSVKAKAPAHP